MIVLFGVWCYLVEDYCWYRVAPWCNWEFIAHVICVSGDGVNLVLRGGRRIVNEDPCGSMTRSKEVLGYWSWAHYEVLADVSAWECFAFGSFIEDELVFDPCVILTRPLLQFGWHFMRLWWKSSRWRVTRSGVRGRENGGNSGSKCRFLAEEGRDQKEVCWQMI